MHKDNPKVVIHSWGKLYFLYIFFTCLQLMEVTRSGPVGVRVAGHVMEE